MCTERILIQNGNFSTEMGVLTRAYTGKYVVYTKNPAVHTVFSQPIKFKLVTQMDFYLAYTVSAEHFACLDCVNKVSTQ